METNQIHATFQSLQQFRYFATVERRIVQYAKADVFELASALVGKVVWFQQGDGVGQGHSLLGRHQLQALFVQG